MEFEFELLEEAEEELLAELEELEAEDELLGVEELEGVPEEEEDWRVACWIPIIVRRRTLFKSEFCL